jgi:drug/metabolite transporter (DMT)-like permease
MRVGDSVAEAESAQAAAWRDWFAIIVCTLAWGTTWYAITLQFGAVDPVISIVYRFALAAGLLFAWSAMRGEPPQLSPAQHGAALGIGVFNFAFNYTLVYWAEERVTSAVVAVVFAAMAFVNLATFRVAFGQRASALAWAAAGLGVLGVAAMSWEELADAEMDARALIGIGLTLAGVVAASVSNVFARRGELAGARVVPLTGWAMLYGAGLLALYALATGKEWAFDWSWSYTLSLVYLSLIGSVIAFVLYYGLARRRGYATASYISALAPPVAMLVSSVFEAKTWGPAALLGVALVLTGQLLLLRTKRA